MSLVGAHARIHARTHAHARIRRAYRTRTGFVRSTTNPVTRRQPSRRARRSRSRSAQHLDSPPIPNHGSATNPLSSPFHTALDRGGSAYSGFARSPLATDELRPPLHHHLHPFSLSLALYLSLSRSRSLPLSPVPLPFSFFLNCTTLATRRLHLPLPHWIISRNPVHWSGYVYYSRLYNSRYGAPEP